MGQAIMVRDASGAQLLFGYARATLMHLVLVNLWQGHGLKGGGAGADEVGDLEEGVRAPSVPACRTE